MLASHTMLGPNVPPTPAKIDESWTSPPNCGVKLPGRPLVMSYAAS